MEAAPASSDPVGIVSQHGPGYQRVLVVGAHPDDPDFGFGATVARLVSEGAVVSYVICTHGTRGGSASALDDQAIAVTRSREQQDAADVLGVQQVVFLGFADGTLAPNLELRRALTREIRRHKPELVLTHFPRRALGVPIEASHPDHTAVGEATLRAVYPDAGNPRSFSELEAEGLPPHRVKEVWLPGYEGANYSVDATPYMQKKIRAILCHRSQLDPNEAEVVPAWVYGWMRQIGQLAGCEYAENFRRLRLEL